MPTAITGWAYKGKQPPDAKPCPFCGGTHLYVEHGDYDATFVKCNDCYCEGPSVIEAWLDDDYDCEPQAWAEWNKRST